MREDTESIELRNYLERAQQGDTRAFDAVVRRYQDRALAYAFVLLGDRGLAEDAAQEAFLQAFRDLPRLDDLDAFAAWLRRIVFKYSDRLRRSRRSAVSLSGFEDALVDERDPALIFARGQDRRANERQVRQVVGLLPQGERSVVVLYYIGGRKQEEVAAFLGLPLTTVKKRLQRSRERLRERMDALSMLENTLAEYAPSRDDRFVEVASLLRNITQLLERDERVLAAYLRRFGSDEGFGGDNDAWASLNIHVVVNDSEIDMLVDKRLAFVAPVGDLLLHEEAPQNAPPGGYYLMTWYDGEAGPYEVNWYWHALSRTVVPGETRLLFDKVGLPVSDQAQPWNYTNDIPEAYRRWEATHTEAEAGRNTLALFWAMWLIAARYVARNPNEEKMGFLPQLRGLIRDLRRFLGETVAEKEPLPPTHMPAQKLSVLRSLASEVEGDLSPRLAERGVALPEKLVARTPHFLAMVEAALPTAEKQD